MSLNYFQGFAVALLVSLLATPLMSRVALSAGLIDHPSEKKFHITSMPALGGAALLFSLLASIIMHGQIRQAPWWISLMSVSVFMFMFGLFDDVAPVRTIFKIIVQSLVSLFLSFNGILLHVTGSTPADVIISLIWFIAVVNCFNFIDISDGLAAGVAAISSFFFFVISLISGNLHLAFISAAICGACVGFLFFNFYPASIFMGNSGSMLVGAMLACIGMLLSKRGDNISILIIPVTAGFIFFDTGMIISSRISAGRKILVSSRDHTIHRLMRMGMSQTGALLACYMIGVFSGFAAFLMMRITIAEASLALMIIIFMTLTTWYLFKDLADYE